MTTDLLTERLLRDFVFADCRLGSHPHVRANVFWRSGDELVLRESSVARDIRKSYRLDLLSSVLGTAFTRPRGAFLYEPDPSLGVADHPEDDRLLLERVDRSLARSVLAVPLRDGKVVVGALSFDSTEPNFLGDRHLAQATLLGSLIVYLTGERNRSRSTPASRSVGEALAQVRKVLSLTQEAFSTQLGVSRIAFSRAEAGAQPPTAGFLYAWCAGLRLLETTAAARVEVVDVTEQVMRVLRADPRELAKLTPAEFERFTAGRLDRMGYDVTLTGNASARDGGIDLVAVPKARNLGGFVIAGQVKHHVGNQRTGRPAVDRLLAWKDSAFRLALLVTNTNFTADALWLAAIQEHRHFLRLRGFDDLKRWIVNDFTSEDDLREIPETIDLAPGVSVRIPRPSLTDIGRVWPHGGRMTRSSRE